MMIANTDQLMDLHDRASRVADDLHRLSEDAASYGLPFVGLKQHGYHVDDWRKSYVHRALGEAMAKEHNSREET